MGEKTIRCQQCGAPVRKYPGAVNRARKFGYALYCDLACAGLARRALDLRTDAQKRADKAEYDRRYREKNRALLKVKKAAWYQANRDPEKERAHRRANMARHVAYCRAYYADPKRKAAKVEYDADRRAMRVMGKRDWADCYRLYIELRNEIRAREPDRYERAKARGYVFNKSKLRRRDAQINRW